MAQFAVAILQVLADELTITVDMKELQGLLRKETDRKSITIEQRGKGSIFFLNFYNIFNLNSLSS